MRKSRLNINQEVSIEITEGSHKGSYKSKVLDFDKKFIELELPFDEDNNPLPLKKKTGLVVFFNTSTALYKFESTVKKRKKKPVYSLVIYNTNKFQRIQRRCFVRIPIQEEIGYRVVSYQNIEKKVDLVTDDKEFKRANTMDISGGGLMLALKDLGEITKGRMLEINLNFINLPINILNGEVVRVQRKEIFNENSSTYLLGVKFVNIPKDVREEIIEWVFSKQRELRKKGLI
ncbi:flagellar brake protein [Orenia marismortui]|uniref:flagellar brake protein n=1 Tax=Orenia marismortui TaxID=46469 RepID=UPI00037C3200|nr:flagellar brake domain-containing protein [Orenia marismortui]